MTYLMSDDLFADSSDLHFGLRTFVLGDGEVQTYVDDGQQEEGKEGRDQQQRLVEHGESKGGKAVNQYLDFLEYFSVQLIIAFEVIPTNLCPY